jgi:hypothetical protein
MAFGRLRSEVGGEKKWELGVGNAELKNRRKVKDERIETAKLGSWDAGKS